MQNVKSHKTEIKVLWKYLLKTWQTGPFPRVQSRNSFMEQKEARRVSKICEDDVLWHVYFRRSERACSPLHVAKK